MFKTVTSISFALILAACAGPTVPVVNLPPSVKTIGLVVSFPPELAMEATGITVFQNSQDIVDISDWNLEDVVYEAALKNINKKYYIVRKSASGYIDHTKSILDEIDHKIPYDNNIDIYTIIYSYPSASAPFQSHDIGMSATKGLISTYIFGVHTFLYISVVDARTKTVIAATPLRYIQENASAIAPSNLPFESIDDFEWQDAWHEYSEVQKDIIKKKIINLLNKSVAFTLQKMHF